MRFVMIALLAVSIQPVFAQDVNHYEEDKLVLFKGKVESIFFHPAILEPEKAFERKSFRMERIYQIMNTYFNTASELKKILKYLYQNNYVLFEHADCFEKNTINGRIQYKAKPIYLPAGKKPLLLTIDDLNYYEFTRYHGTVHRLTIDGKGSLAAVVFEKNGKMKYLYDGDIVLIIENFIQQHPDFSYKGARGIIALTGREGVLGFPTHLLNDKYYEYNKKTATQVANKLKEKGWKFASHSYKHIFAQLSSYDYIVKDTLRWKKEVEPIVGSTPYYIYAYGSPVPPKGNKIGFLLKQGFSYFFGVDFESKFYFNKGSYVYIDRIPIDGHYVRGKYRNSRISQFFPIREVIDPVRIRYDNQSQLAHKNKPGKKKKAA